MSFAYTPINLGTGGTSATSSSRGGGWATVGASGADYPSIGAAVSGQQVVISVIANTTESANITVPTSGLFVFLYNDSVVSMGTRNFTVPSGVKLFVEGEGQISYGNSNGGTLFNGSGTLYVNSITVNNNNTGATCFTNINYARITNVVFNGDVRICGNFNIYNDNIFRNGTVLFASGTNKSAVHGAVTESVLIVDSGTNSIVSDILGG